MGRVSACEGSVAEGAWHAGKQVGPWRVERVIGRGAMAVVWLGRHEVSGERAAIKVLHRSLARRPDMVRRFLGEAQALRRIRHRNVVRILDFAAAQDGGLGIVLEHLEGLTLEQRARLGPLSLEDALGVLLGVCEGLAAAHRAGIVHRDVKAENVFLAGAEGEPKLFDFGIAALGPEAPAGPGGRVLGTPTYMSPEQATGARVDARADVYAVGVLAHRLLGGALPFRAASPQEVMRLQARAEPPPLGAPAPVAQIVRRALSKHPDARPAHAGELAHLLRAAAAEAGCALPAAAGPATQTARRTGA